MHSRRSRYSSIWSDWTWNPEHECLVRYRDSTKGGQKWEYKYENGQVTSLYLNSHETSRLDQANKTSGRLDAEDAMVDEDHEVTTDDQSIGISNSNVSTLGIQIQSSSAPIPRLPGLGQNQNPSTAVANLTQPPAYHKHVNNETDLSYKASLLPPQSQYPAPRWQGSVGSSTIKTRDPRISAERLDKNFRIHESKKFKFGKRLMSRRPILTYTNQGTVEPGVRQEDHAVVYTDKDAGPESCLFPGETRTKTALQMEPENSSHKLAPASRVNYAKIYTVEHNVKVQFIGALTRNAQAQLRVDFNMTHPVLQHIQPEPGYILEGLVENTEELASDSLVQSTGVGIRITDDMTDSAYGGSVMGDWLSSTYSASHSKNSGAHENYDSLYDVDELETSSMRGPNYCYRDGYSQTPASFEKDTFPSPVTAKIPERGGRKIETVRNETLDHISETSQIEGGDHKGTGLKNDIKEFSSVGKAGSSLRNLSRSKLFGSEGAFVEENMAFPSDDPVVAFAQASDLPSLLATGNTTQDTTDNIGADSVDLRAMTSTESRDRDRLLELVHQEVRWRPLRNGYTQNGSSCLEDTEIFEALVILSTDLKHEAKSIGELNIAKGVQKYAAYVAWYVARSLKNKDSSWTLFNQDHNSDIKETTFKLPFSTDEMEIYQEVGSFHDILANRPFKLFRESLESLICEKSIRQVLGKIWEPRWQKSSARVVRYHVHWELFSFLRTEFPDTQALGKVLTISGEGNEAQAQNCRDYLVANWPGFGDLLVEAFEDLRRFGVEVHKGNDQVTLAVDFLNAGDSADQQEHVSLTVEAVHSTHSKVISAVSWLCAALRASPHGTIAYSSPLVEANTTDTGEKIIDIRLDALEVFSGERCCWHPLFPHSVIARNFPIRKRLGGKGLEISFPNMASMAQSVDLVQHDGGLIAEGLRWYLIPSELLPFGGVQWHLEFKRQGGAAPRKRTLFEVLRQSHLSKRFKTLDIDYLIESRCFLGWAEEVEVVIGSEAYHTRQLSWSLAKKSPKAGHGYYRLTSHPISRGCDGMDISGYTNFGQPIPVDNVSQRTWDRCSGISATIDDDYQANTLIYDTRTKTAFLLPKADVVLLLLHKMIHRRNYQLFKGDEEATLRFASPTTETREIFFLQESLYYAKRRRGPHWPSGHSSFCTVIEEAWNHLDIVEGGLVEVEYKATAIQTLRGGTAIRNVTTERLYGIEFMDVERMARDMVVGQIEMDEPWVHLVKSEPLVAILFCQGLGQPIVPTVPEKLCAAWAAVPPCRNFMATTGRSLCPLLERHVDGDMGTRLGEKVEWKVPGATVQEASNTCLIYHHEHNSQAFVYHEQHLKMVPNAELNKDLHDLVMRFAKSGFIFGSSSAKKCQAGLIGDIGGPPVDADDDVDEADDVPEGSSNTSAELGCGSNLEQSWHISASSSVYSQDSR